MPEEAFYVTTASLLLLFRILHTWQNTIKHIYSVLLFIVGSLANYCFMVLKHITLLI